MSSANSSKKQIIKASSIIGGASFLTILISLIKVKALAVLLGPAGLGIMGILTSLMTAGATFFGLGLGTSGVRQLVLNKGSAEKLALVRKALFTANCTLGFSALILIFLFRIELSELLMKNSQYQTAISIIGLGVFFSLVSISQTVVLQGLRKITELAKVNVISSIISTLLGLLIIWAFGEHGIPLLIISLPIVTCFVAYFYTNQLSKVKSTFINIKQLKPQWYSMITFGFVFMLTGLMTSACQLIVKYILNQELNMESVGYFQASWAISMMYIGFVLGAMGADYYPRLTEVISNKEDSNRLVNEQTEIAIVLAAPVLLGMLAFAPLVIHLLYSSEFISSIEILRWQVFGDILKIISWPIGFVILAKGKGKIFFITELIWNLSYVLLVFFGVKVYGVEITGYAFVLSYLLLLLTVYVVATHLNGFKWSKNNINLISILLFAAISLMLTSYFSPLITMLLGTALVFISSVYTLNTLSKLGITNSKVMKILNIYKKLKKCWD